MTGLSMLLTSKGLIDEAKRTIEEGLEVAEGSLMRSHGVTHLLSTMVRNRLAANDLAWAELAINEGIATARSHGHCVSCHATLLPEAVRVSLALGRQDEAEQFALELEETAAKFGTRVWSALAKHGRARVLARAGDLRAEQTYDEARESFVAVEYVYEAARCLNGKAGIVRRRDPAQADVLEAEAKAVFATLGAAGIE